jgi:hypothetical protein
MKYLPHYIRIVGSTTADTELAGKHRQLLSQGLPLEGPASPVVQVGADAQCSAGNALRALGRELGNNGAPPVDRNGCDIQRSGGVLGVSEVQNQFGLEHGATVTSVPQGRPTVTLVHRSAKSTFHRPVITLVTNMRVDDLVEIPEHWQDCQQFFERLGWSMRRKDKQIAEVAEAVEVTPNAVRKWLKTRVRGIKSNELFTVAYFLDVNAKWLATGVGSPFADELAQLLQAAALLVEPIKQFQQALTAVLALAAPQHLPQQPSAARPAAANEATGTTRKKKRP